MITSRDLSRFICSCRSGKVQVQVQGADVMSSLCNKLLPINKVPQYYFYIGKRKIS